MQTDTRFGGSDTAWIGWMGKEESIFAKICAENQAAYESWKWNLWDM